MIIHYTMNFQALSSQKRKYLEKFLDLGLLNTYTWLAGGALQPLADADQYVKDFDMFFFDKEHLESAKGKLVDEGFEQVFACKNGELFTYKHATDKTFPKVQLIAKFYYQDIYHVIDSFDIVAGMWATDGTLLVTTKQAIRDTVKKKVNLNRVTSPVATMNRFLKYNARKGYTVTPDAMLKYVIEVNTNEFDGDNLALYLD